MSSENTWISMMQEVQRSGRLVVSGDMYGHVGKDRAEYED